MSIEDSLADAIRHGGDSSPWGRIDQYTLVDYDEETMLSTLETVNDTIANVPKLEHVKLEGGWVRVGSATYNSGTEHLLVFPRSDYSLFEIHMSGTLSATSSVNIRMNDNSSANLHRRIHTRWTHTGTVASSNASEGTVWPLHSNIGGVHCNAQVEIWRGSANLWHMEGRDQTATSSTGEQTLYSGRLNSDIGDIDRMRFMTGDGVSTFNDVRILIYGRTRPVQVGTQVLAMKTRSHPLVIIGMLAGTTI